MPCPWYSRLVAQGVKGKTWRGYCYSPSPSINNQISVATSLLTVEAYILDQLVSALGSVVPTIIRKFSWIKKIRNVRESSWMIKVSDEIGKLCMFLHYSSFETNVYVWYINHGHYIVFSCNSAHRLSDCLVMHDPLTHPAHALIAPHRQHNAPHRQHNAASPAQSASQC